MSFWQSGTGVIPTGTPEAAFLKDFSVIPNGTTALAKIVNFSNVDQENKHTGHWDKYIQIIWKLTEGEYKGREVSQKIKCFSGTPESIDRNLNMLRLIMTLCQFSPTHQNAPTDPELKKMEGKACGIKIREWSLPKADGTGMAEGNFVSEVYDTKGFEAERGVKLEPKPSPLPVQSALSRNHKHANNTLIDDDVPFFQ